MQSRERNVVKRRQSRHKNVGVEINVDCQEEQRAHTVETK